MANEDLLASYKTKYKARKNDKITQEEKDAVVALVETEGVAAFGAFMGVKWPAEKKAKK